MPPPSQCPSDGYAELPTPVMLDFCDLVGTDELAGADRHDPLGKPHPGGRSASSSATCRRGS
jgi:hypothetical protein